MYHSLYDWFGLNTLLFKLINGLITVPWYNQAMVLFSEVGNYRRFHLFVAFVLVFMLARLLQEKLRDGQVPQGAWRRIAALMIVLMMGYVFTGLVVGALKSIIHVPRPFMVHQAAGAMVYLYPAYPVREEHFASFPSAHAASIAFLVTALWPMLWKEARPVAVAAIFWVCWARIAVGMHYPVDVVGGVLVGAGVARVVRRYVYRMLRIAEEPANAT